MAISFLDNITLNNLEIQNVVLQNLSSDPTGVEGKIIYNTGTKKVKYYNGTSWISLPDGTGIGGSGTVGTIPVFNSTSEITDSQLETTGSGSSQTFTFNTTGQTSFKGDVNFDAGVKDKDGQLGTSGQLLSSTGTRINWIDAPVSYTKWILTGDAGTPQDIGDGNTVKIAGGSNISTSASATDTVTVSLNGTINIGTLNVSDTGQNSFTGQVTIPATPTASTDAASKGYVDASVVGGFTVKGGFNANTGVTAVAGTNLYTGTALAKGDFYVVTVAGNFFGNAATPLTVGDSVLVQTAAASGSAVEGDFAVIQSDTDLATLTTVGIGNVNKAPAGNKAGTIVSYSAGTATVGLDIVNLTQGAAAAEMQFVVNDNGGSGNNEKLDISALADFVLNTRKQFVGTTSNVTSHVFTHSLNSFNVIVQLFDTSTKETVYAAVDRTSVNVVTVTTAANASLTCLIDKIG